jgi:hypothetical protein
MADTDRRRDLHDATLLSVVLAWSSGTATLHVRPVSDTTGNCTIVATDLAAFECSRRLPWGHSVSILEARHGASASGEAVLEIEMQSGDRLTMVAGRIEFRDEDSD